MLDAVEACNNGADSPPCLSHLGRLAPHEAASEGVPTEQLASRLPWAWLVAAHGAAVMLLATCILALMLCPRGFRGLHERARTVLRRMARWPRFAELALLLLTWSTLATALVVTFHPSAGGSNEREHEGAAGASEGLVLHRALVAAVGPAAVLLAVHSV